MVVFGGHGPAVELLVNLGHEEREAGLDVSAVRGLQGHVDIFHRFLVLLLRHRGFHHGQIELVALRAAEVPLRQLLHQQVEGGLGLRVASLLRHAAGQQHGALVGGMGAFELRDEDIAGVGSAHIVLLVEGGVGRKQVALLDIGHMLFATHEDAVFLYTLDTLLDGAVHFGIHRPGSLFGAQVFGREESGVVVDSVFLQLLQTSLQTLVAVPPHIIVAGGVVELHVGPLGLLGRAACEKER